MRCTVSKTSKFMISMYIDLHVKYSLFLSDFNETCIPRQIFEKFWKYQITWNPSCGCRVFPYRRMDGHDDAKNRFLQFCKRALKRIFFKNQHLHNCLFSRITIHVIPYLISIMLNRNDGFAIFIYRSRVIAFVASRVIYSLWNTRLLRLFNYVIVHIL